MNDNWHNDRDLRTDNCEGVTPTYKKAVIHVIVTEDIGQFRVQLMTFLTLKILSKWCRHIYLTVQQTTSHLSSCKENYEDFLRKEITAADPECNLCINDDNQSLPVTIALFVGTPNENAKYDFVSINASGWVAVCAFNKTTSILSTNSNINIGACFAATLANAELFRYMVEIRSNQYTKWYSLWENAVLDYAPDITFYGNDIPVIDFGRIHLIGCGAIGSSFATLFPFVNCKAEFLLVDPDHVKHHNVSSSLLFNFNDAEGRLLKVDLCKTYLLKTGLKAKEFVGDYNSYEFNHQGTDISGADIVLCFANENNIWATIQNGYPPLCFHATTSKSWGINIGRHIPLKDNCLMCTFQDMVEVNYVPVCAEAEIEIEKGNKKQTHTAILPFLSPAAALITLAEMIKTLIIPPSFDSELVFNMKTSEGIFVGKGEQFGSCFICKGQQELYDELGLAGKFWNLLST
jgi:hypothetical protein